jgi:hypothetical protein
VGGGEIVGGFGFNRSCLHLFFHAGSNDLHSSCANLNVSVFADV